MLLPPAQDVNTLKKRTASNSPDKEKREGKNFATRNTTTYAPPARTVLSEITNKVVNKRLCVAGDAVPVKSLRDVEAASENAVSEYNNSQAQDSDMENRDPTTVSSETESEDELAQDTPLKSRKAAKKDDRSETTTST